MKALTPVEAKPVSNERGPKALNVDVPLWKWQRVGNRRGSGMARGFIFPASKGSRGKFARGAFA